VFPSGSPTDGRFVSVAGNGLSTMTNERLSFFIAVEDGVPSFRIDIFDGDTGKDDAGTYNWGIGNWTTAARRTRS
jgi:hypothetical protein